MTTTKEREYNGTRWNYRGITYVTYEQGLGVNAPKHIVYRRNPLCDFVPCSTAGWVVYVREIRASTFMLTTEERSSDDESERRRLLNEMEQGRFPEVRPRLRPNSKAGTVSRRNEKGSFRANKGNDSYFSLSLKERFEFLVSSIVRRIISISNRRIIKFRTWSLKVNLKRTVCYFNSLRDLHCKINGLIFEEHFTFTFQN